MNLKKILHKCLIFVVVCILPLALLLTTNAGLNTVLTVATMFAPCPFSYGTAKGKLIGQAIEVSDVFVEYAGRPLKIGSLVLDWQQRLFNAKDVQGLEGYLPLADQIKYREIQIDAIYGYVALSDNKHVANIQLNGHTQNTPILGTARIIHIGDKWDLDHIFVNYGQNTASITQKEQQYSWKIALTDPARIFKDSQGSLHASGSIQDLQTIPNIQSRVQTQYFGLNQYQIKNLDANINLQLQPETPLYANISAKSLKIGSQLLQNLNLKLNGTLEQHSVRSNATYNNEPISIALNGNYAKKVWDIPNIIVSYKNEQLQGSANYDFNTQIGGSELQGSIMRFPTQASMQLGLGHSELKFNMYISDKNNLHGLLKITNSDLDGNIKVEADDIAFLMDWMPDVTRLKGDFKSDIKIRGTIDNPEITSNSQVTDITATIPSLGIKIKPMSLYLSSDKHGKFILNGEGKMRRGPGEFTVHGYVEPFKEDMPNSITFAATKLEFVNNQTANLIASSHLQIHYAQAQQRVDVTGDIEVHEGKVTIAQNRTQTVKSKDVVFVNETNTTTKQLIALNPNINLRINDGVHFTGFDLDADVSGKLNISHRHDALYADGRVTIKQGTYQLPGQKLQINHGRLLYPPGTLLVNPVLDIKMLGLGKDKASINANSKPDIELTVQGTAQKPLISESGLSSDKDRALSQAILTGSSVLSNNMLQDKLKITEIGLTSREQEHVDFFDDPSQDKNSIRNKDFVIGRSLGKKFYIQYLHSMGEANQRVRLKYALNDIWAIGLESGTTGGGVDLSFAIERD